MIKFQKSVSLLLVFFLCTLFSFAKQDDVFYRKTEDGKYLFFYDKFYYLNSENCQFTYIIRETQFDPTTQTFNGEFVDFDIFERVLLKGKHENGLREGAFEAFHYNGKTKWKGNFQAGVPVGVWEYFYPDGKPMLFIEISEIGLNFKDFYDLEGKKRVSDGDGRYSMRVEVDVFTEEGAAYLLKSGRVRNGKPEGHWRVDVITQDDQTYFLKYDQYKAGRLQNPSGIEDEIYGNARYGILPLDWFYRADEFTFKSCRIDDQSGFTEYLKKVIDMQVESLYASNSEIVSLEYTFNLSASGIASQFEAKDRAYMPEFNKAVEIILEGIPFWMPSFFKEDFIQDKLTIKLDLIPNHELETFETYNIDIVREKGI